MLGTVFGLLVKVGTIGGAMTGAGMVVEGVRRGVERFAPRYAPVVSGPLDNIGTLLDPLDLTGVRAKKQKEQEQRLAAAQGDAKAQAKAKEEARKRAKAAEDKAAKADKKADKLAAEVARLKASGKDAQAKIKALEAEKTRRWAQGTRQFAARARQAPDGNQANALALAALDLAKNAMNPPRTAAEVLTPGMSDAAKGFVIDMVDQVNRVGTEPDFEGLLNRIESGDASAYEELADLSYDVEGQTVEGPCCSSCAVGHTTCASKKEVPKSLLFGSIEGDEDEEDDWFTGGGMFDEGEDD